MISLLLILLKKSNSFLRFNETSNKIKSNKSSRQSLFKACIKYRSVPKMQDNEFFSIL